MATATMATIAGVQVELTNLDKVLYPETGCTKAQVIRDGKVEVFFDGSRIRGGYAFIRIHRADEEREDWLLIKLRDRYVGSLPEDLEELPQSVITGRTVKDLKRSAKTKAK